MRDPAVGRRASNWTGRPELGGPTGAEVATMNRLKWSIGCALAMLAAAAGSACTNGTATGGATPSASAPAATPPTSPAATPPRSPVAGPTAAAGVSVALGATKYAVGDVVEVTVTNGRGEPVYTEDFQTECTIVTLQASNAGSWNDITGCGMGRPTRTVVLQPGEAKQVRLDPHNFHLAEGSGQLGFGAGTYRVRFGYRLAAEPMGAQPLTAYSENFVVG
jgi:hypothetical protein